MTGAVAGGARISATIMAHPSRLPQAADLRDRHPGLALQIVTDPEPGRGHSLSTARRAWGTVAADATHHFVVQDDCLLCEDFTDRLHAAVRARPGDALSFFAEWGCRTGSAVRLAALEGAAWARAVDPYVPTQAVVLPAGLARAFAASGEGVDDPDDITLARWLSARGVAAYVSVPNLVQHMDLPSLVGNGFQGPRLAACFGPALEFQPAGSAVADLTWLPHMSWMRAESECFSRDPRGAGDWTAWPTSAFLTSRFGSGDLARAAFTEAVAAVPGMDDVTSQVSGVALLEVWLTGYALGVLLAERAPASTAGGPASTAGGRASTAGGRATAHRGGPVVASALASLAPGGLRRFLAGPLLARLAEPLSRFVAEAVRRGCESGGAVSMIPEPFQ